MLRRRLQATWVWLMVATWLVLSLGFSVAEAASDAVLGGGEGRPVEVVVAGTVVMRFVEPYKGIGPQERADAVYQRIWQLVNSATPAERGTMATRVQVDMDGSDVVIRVGDALIATVDEIHARRQGGSPQALAQIWATNLRQALERLLEGDLWRIAPAVGEG